MIKRIFLSVYFISKSFGFDPLRLLSTLRGLPYYLSDLMKLRSQISKGGDFQIKKYKARLGDRNAGSGTISGHYFHQDLLVAKKIYAANPGKHVDIGSRIDGFVAHVAVFRVIEIMDIRPARSKVLNIISKQADLMKLDPSYIDYCDSISSLHTIEHFGLGRYGDPIDVDGHIKGIKNIASILKKGGVFYFSVPIGPQRIEFNAHRVFDVAYLLNVLKPMFTLKSFSYVNDAGDLIEDAAITEQGLANNFGCYYGCGIFELQKI